MKHSEKYEKTKIPNTQDLMESYELNTTFFRLNHTNKVFPKFKFTKDNIPVGDSVTMCLSANWAPTERGKNFDIMKETKPRMLIQDNVVSFTNFAEYPSKGNESDSKNIINNII